MALEDAALDSLDKVAALGPERVKAELARRGLKCGGTLAERAQRLFSVRGLREDEVDKKLRSLPAQKR